MSQDNLSEYQLNYLAYRTAKIAEINQNINKQNAMLQQNYSNQLYFEFGQSSSRHLKRRLNYGGNQIHIVYDWLRNNGKK